jgi:hypothetical protein
MKVRKLSLIIQHSRKNKRQVSEPDSVMIDNPKLSDRAFKIAVINVLRVLAQKKVNNMRE